MTEEYSNLATVKQQVAEKIQSNIRIKEKLLTAIKDVHTIDDPVSYTHLTLPTN